MVLVSAMFMGRRGETKKEKKERGKKKERRRRMNMR